MTAGNNATSGADLPIGPTAGAAFMIALGSARFHDLDLAPASRRPHTRGLVKIGRSEIMKP